ncbi:PmeII family type II restriction endonuclease [Ottowia sp.]|uniref:PmeII family type II restriction endonuclease n=1 Tax=Ottowia sp. TaxID=1898956 RepID=UPI003A86A1F5
MTLIQSAEGYVQSRIAPEFHDKRLAKLRELKLAQVLKRKNPYLFRAKAIVSAPDLVKHLLLAYLSSQEETIFGDFLEGLAIHICHQAFGGQKSTAEGIDLEFAREGVRYIVSVKSGPNWGNSSQINKMVQNFDKARRIAGRHTQLVAVNGCCYGRDAKPDKTKGNYVKLCGQDFWNLISGEPLLYQKIIEPLGYQARLRNDEFEQAFARLQTVFTAEFTKDFCLSDGSMDWDKLVALNSSAKELWIS